MKAIRDVPVPDLTGKVAVVTGASDGIGLGIAVRLASAGAELVLPVRNPAKGARALEVVAARAPGSVASTRELDLASLSSVKHLSETLLSEGRPLHLFVANAGVMTPPERTLTTDGFELQFGTNHLGHMALIGRVLPLLQMGEARVTTMSSSAAAQGATDWDDLARANRYKAIRSYSASKLAQLMFAMELDRRSQELGWRISSNAAHPGTTYSNLYASGPNLGRTKPSPIDGIFRRLSTIGVFVQSVDSGLLPALHAAVSPDAEGGRYYGPDGLGQFTGSAKELKLPRRANAHSDAARLWALSEEVTGVTFPPAASSASSDDTGGRPSDPRRGRR